MSCRERRKMLVDGFDAGFAAQPTTGGDEDVAGEAFKIDFYFGGKEDVEDVFFFVAGVGFNFGNVLGFGDEAFAQKETGGEFAVVAGSAHGHGDRLVVDADFQGFFNGDGVGFGCGTFAGLPADDFGLALHWLILKPYFGEVEVTTGYAGRRKLFEE